MSDPSLELQKAVRARLVASESVTNLVPANNIADFNNLPAAMPCINMGDGQSNFETGAIDCDRAEVFLDLHVWTRETGLSQSKILCNAIHSALSARLWETTNYEVGMFYVRGSRHMRDPDGITSHSVVTVKADMRQKPGEEQENFVLVNGHWSDGGRWSDTATWEEMVL